MSQIEQLQELIAMLDDHNGSVPEMLEPTGVEPEMLAAVVERRARVVVHKFVRGSELDSRTLHLIIGAALMDGFALGCAWSKLRQGSTEK